jgi:hypothetical protein
MTDIVIRMRYDESIGRVVTNVVTVYKEIICENNVRIIEINFREYPYYVSLRFELRVVMYVTISAEEPYSVRLFLQLFVGGLMPYLRYYY